MNEILKRGEGKRKYFTQITVEELASIKGRIAESKKWNLSKHTRERMVQKRINVSHAKIVENILNSDVIEYKIDRRAKGGQQYLDERVLLEGTEMVLNGRKVRLKIVISLTTHDVITVWSNCVNDLHQTLDWSAYDENMEIPII